MTVYQITYRKSATTLEITKAYLCAMNIPTDSRATQNPTSYEYAMWAQKNWESKGGKNRDMSWSEMSNWVIFTNYDYRLGHTQTAVLLSMKRIYPQPIVRRIFQ